MLYEKFYDSNKYLQQIYVDIKHSMGSDKGISFLNLYVKLALKNKNKNYIIQGRLISVYQAGRQRFCAE
jgi:hypothetical protein